MKSPSCGHCIINLSLSPCSLFPKAVELDKYYEGLIKFGKDFM